LGVLIAPWHIRLLADAVYVPGERQAYFARRLGFRTILRGCLSCDHTNFSKIYLERTLSNNNPPNAFLFVGRLIAEKGISTLAEAYRIYRQFSSAPWPLICCGVGPQARLLESLTGVEMRGFVQPQELPEQMARASVLVIPSIFEPWALVVHEAAAAGLLILASEAVGSVPHLVHDNHNGYTFNPGDARRMAHLMGKISNLSSESIQQMSMASYAVSLQNTPQRWANTVMAFAVDYSGRQLRSHRD
jgi:glycosyltransferase involved in cell wall biosynthesis